MRNFSLFLIKIISCFSLVISIFALIVRLNSTVLQTNQSQNDFMTDFWSKARYLETLSKQENQIVVFLGHSSCARGIDPTLLNYATKSPKKISYFNFCLEGDAHLKLNLAILDRTIKILGAKLKGVIFAAPFALTNNYYIDQDIEERWNYYNQSDYSPLNPSKINGNWTTDIFNFLKKIRFAYVESIITRDWNYTLNEYTHYHQITKEGMLIETNPLFETDQFSNSEYKKFKFFIGSLLNSSKQQSISFKVFLKNLKPYAKKTKVIFLDLPTHPKIYNDFKQARKAKLEINNIIYSDSNFSSVEISSNNLKFTDPLHYQIASIPQINQEIKKKLAHFFID